MLTDMINVYFSQFYVTLVIRYFSNKSAFVLITVCCSGDFLSYPIHHVMAKISFVNSKNRAFPVSRTNSLHNSREAKIRCRPNLHSLADHPKTASKNGV